MTRDIIKKVPQIIEHPICVLNSRTQENRIVIYGEVTDVNNNPVLAALELMPKNKNGDVLDFSVITSAYSKENTAYFIKNSDLLYLDENKKRTNKWLSTVGLQLPSVADTKYGSMGNISYEENNVNISGIDFRQYMYPTAMELAFRNAKRLPTERYSVAEEPEAISLPKEGVLT